MKRLIFCMAFLLTACLPHEEPIQENYSSSSKSSVQSSARSSASSADIFLAWTDVEVSGLVLTVPPKWFVENRDEYSILLRHSEDDVQLSLEAFTGDVQRDKAGFDFVRTDVFEGNDMNWDVVYLSGSCIMSGVNYCRMESPEYDPSVKSLRAIRATSAERNGDYRYFVEIQFHNEKYVFDFKSMLHELQIIPLSPSGDPSHSVRKD